MLASDVHAAPLTSTSSESHWRANRTGRTGKRRRSALIIIAAVAAVILVSVFSAVRFVELRRAAQARATFTQAQKEFAGGEFAESANSARRSIDLGSRSPGSYALLGRSLEAEGDLSGASEAYVASLQTDSAQPEIAVRLAIVRGELGQSADAREALARLLKSDPNLVSARLALADLQATAGMHRDAIKNYKAVLARHPYGVSARAIKKKIGALQ